MAWLTALWHLVGALSAQPDLRPVTLLAGAAVAVLAIALHTSTRRTVGEAGPAPAAVVRRHASTRPRVRLADPDAPGHARPRAPSR